MGGMIVTLPTQRGCDAGLRHGLPRRRAAPVSSAPSSRPCCRRDQLERDVDDLIHGLAPRKGERSVDGAGSLAGAFWNTVTSSSPAFIAARPSWVASTPTTTTSFMSMPALFIAWIAPIAISSLLAKTASNGSPAVSQLVIRSSAALRDQPAVCSSMILMKSHTSVLSDVAHGLGPLERRVVREIAHQDIGARAILLALSRRSLQASEAPSMPDSVSFEPT